MSLKSTARAPFVSVLLAMLTLVVGADLARAEVESNLVLKSIVNFHGTLDSIPVPFGDSTVPSGPISLSLDPDGTNVFGLDEALGQGYIDVTLFLSSPLLSQLNDTPKIRIIEAGPAYIQMVEQDSARSQAALSTICDDFDFLFWSYLTGGGTVENGLFAGTTYENVNAYQGTGTLGSWIVSPGSLVAWDIINTGVITFPSGYKVENVGGRGYMTIAVPEPFTGLLATVGAVGCALLLRKRSVRRAA